MIGFIGLGIMGRPMCKNLLHAARAVMVYDLSAPAVAELAGCGALVGASPADVAAQSDCIITMLPDSPEVLTCVLGKDGILAGARAGAILIDMSSIDPQASRDVSDQCRRQGVAMLDAPVSGGEPKAIDGTLAIMVGGEKDIFERVKDILNVMGSSVTYCGAIGAGNTVKLANQIIVALNIAALAEALTLARKAGVDPAIVLEAIRGGLAGSTVLNAKGPMMLQNNFQPGFKIDLHIKDLNNALSAGHRNGAPLPLTAAVQEMLQTLHADGLGQKDHSALACFYAKLSGQTIG